MLLDSGASRYRSHRRIRLHIPRDQYRSDPEGKTARSHPVPQGTEMDPDLIARRVGREDVNRAVGGRHVVLVVRDHGRTTGVAGRDHRGRHTSRCERPTGLALQQSSHSGHRIRG